MKRIVLNLLLLTIALSLFAAQVPGNQNGTG